MLYIALSILIIGLLYLINMESRWRRDVEQERNHYRSLAYRWGDALVARNIITPEVLEHDFRIPN